MSIRTEPDASPILDSHMYLGQGAKFAQIPLAFPFSFWGHFEALWINPRHIMKMSWGVFNCIGMPTLKICHTMLLSLQGKPMHTWTKGQKLSKHRWHFPY